MKFKICCKVEKYSIKLIQLDRRHLENLYQFIHFSTLKLSWALNLNCTKL